MKSQGNKIAILGAGPAGLTAGWCLPKEPKDSIKIFESQSQVGGISKTVIAGEWRFDLAGHGFFSKSEKVNNLWDEMLYPDVFLLRPRKSRIFYNGKFFDYPLKPLNALFNLGVLETFLCISSYIWVRIKPPKKQDTFEDWVAARFGWRLYKIFFKTYTEKVWGISTKQLQSTWAAQRIKNLSLLEAIKDAFGFSKKRSITTLIDEFKYPRLGPGQLWENVAEKLTIDGIEISMNSKVNTVGLDGNYIINFYDKDSYRADKVFSSLPLAEIPELLNAPERVKAAGNRLKFRDFLVVAIPVESNTKLFDDNWIYIHDPKVKVGRIQNYLSWSEELVRPGTSCLGLEYFVNENDSIWNMSDEDLISFGRSELLKIGIKCNFLDEKGYVVRVPKAYPVYDGEYEDSVLCIKEWLKSEHPNWYQIGRNGQHHYNNQDHSMLTAYHAVSNSNGVFMEDYWEVNLDNDYHEISKISRDAPIFR